jgi:hypothetical protein
VHAALFKARSVAITPGSTTLGAAAERSRFKLELLGIDPYFDPLSEGVAPSLVDLIVSANRMAMHKVMRHCTEA